MSYLKNIITYFFHHPASDGVVERVHQRLADTNSGQEKEEVLSVEVDGIVYIYQLFFIAYVIHLIDREREK